MMTDGQFDVDIAHELLGLIAWRKKKAERHPEDARNMEAVSIAERLLADLESGSKPAPDQQKKLDELAAKLESLVKKQDQREAVKDLISAYWRDIGFHSHPETVGDVFDSICMIYADEIQDLKELKSKTRAPRPRRRAAPSVD